MAKLINTWPAGALAKLARFLRAEAQGNRFRKFAEEARARVAKVSADQAFEALAYGTTLIDVREKEEFLRLHIPRALHLSRGTIELEIERRVSDPTAELIVYCEGEDRSVLAADNLQRMGYTGVKILAGGFRAWLDAGFPATHDSYLIED